MSAVPLNPELRAEYEQLFRTCTVQPGRAAVADSLASKIAASRAEYEAVAVPLGIPWQFVGVVHCMEAGLNFNCHLHNGDSLQRRTVQVPRGRPIDGTPPFTWRDSARDALVYERLDRRTDWSLAGLLHCLEGYNGWGYRKYHGDVRSPYLWSFSNQYTRGKYVADGTWDPNAVSQQCGAAVLLHGLAQKGLFDAAGLPPAPALPAAAAQPVPPGLPLIRYYAGGPESEAARQLQLLLNQLLGTTLVTDGKPGRQTSDAVERLLGHRLAGDPRG